MSKDQIYTFLCGNMSTSILNKNLLHSKIFLNIKFSTNFFFENLFIY